MVKTVYRPWGYYQEIEGWENFKVKHLIIKPGHFIALQKHNKRSEHWVVIEGQASVVVGELAFDINRDDHVYIPRRIKHRIENKGSKILHILETQLGNNCTEEDIVRYERYEKGDEC